MAIGEFIQDLKKIGLYENSLIFIWGDHGSMTNISTALGKDKNTLPELTDSQVPMIMLAPGTDLSGTNNTPASHLDVYPTITNLLGINAPKTVLGQDILNTKTPVETHFRIISDGIDAILTPNLVYQAGNDGIFAEGTCKVWPSLESLPVLDCQNLYNQQAENVRASDIIIEGNLLNNLLDKKK
jgi:arylsulfatase A-like enzyme